MSSTTRWLNVMTASTVAAFGAGCDKPAAETTAPTASAATAAAAASTPAAAPPPAPKPAGPKPSHPCPDGSEGEGTLAKPCEAKGSARVMEVQWTGKIKDQGPSFRVTNKAKLEILYGNVFVYFYDKAGKQLEVGTGEKARGYRSCGGNIFAGPMKPAEKAVIYFSCVKQKDVPEGTAAIEAEIKTAGFTAKDGKRSDTFWQNKDLAPAKRPKGGVK